MKKILTLFLFICFSQVSQAASMISISNSMMTSNSSQMGTLDLGTFDPFNPSLNCNTYSAPNSCTANGRDPVNINLVFNYSVELDSLTGSSVDLVVNINNGLGGSMGEFINLNPPVSLFSLQDGSVGSFDLNFQIPLFGPNAHYEYGLDLIIDVTINP